MMKKKGMFRRSIAAALTVATVFASASTILAYEPFAPVYEGTMEVVSSDEFGAFSIEETIPKDYTNVYDFSISDDIFIYEDGTQVPITSVDSSYVLCNHTMVSGYYTTHRSNDSGGCTVTEYNAQKCSKCGYLILGSVHNTATYSVCPHN